MATLKTALYKTVLTFGEVTGGNGWASVYKPQGPLPFTWLSFEADKWQITTAISLGKPPAKPAPTGLKLNGVMML